MTDFKLSRVCSSRFKSSFAMCLFPVVSLTMAIGAYPSVAVGQNTLVLRGLGPESLGRQPNEMLGSSIAIADGSLAVGAPEPIAGSDRVGATFLGATRFACPDAPNCVGGLFGHSVSVGISPIGTRRAAVGAPLSNQSGRVFVYNLNNLGFIELFNAPNAPGTHSFGGTVAMNGVNLLASSSTVNLPGLRFGRVEFINRTSGQEGRFAIESPIISSEFLTGIGFGTAISVDGNVAVIGSGGGLGNAFLISADFNQDAPIPAGDVLGRLQPLRDEFRNNNDRDRFGFGQSVDISPNWIAVASERSVTVYDRTTRLPVRRFDNVIPTTAISVTGNTLVIGSSGLPFPLFGGSVSTYDILSGSQTGSFSPGSQDLNNLNGGAPPNGTVFRLGTVGRFGSAVDSEFVDGSNGGLVRVLIGAPTSRVVELRNGVSQSTLDNAGAVFEARVPNTLGTVVQNGIRAGDLNNNGVVNEEDINFLRRRQLFVGDSFGSLFRDRNLAPDLNQDGMINELDRYEIVENYVETTQGGIGTFLGDFDLDGDVDVLGDSFIFVANLGSSTIRWSMGDINGDEEVDVLGDGFILAANLGSGT